METPQVYAAINKVAAALCVKGVGKGRTASTGASGSYKFRGIDDFYNALAPELAAHGLCILPRCQHREVVERQSASNKALFYTTVTMEFDFVAAADGSKHTVGPFYGEAMDSGDKATNKAMSAAFKYCVMQAFAIPVEGQSVDSETETHEVKPKTDADKLAAGNYSGGKVAGDAFAALPEDQQTFLREQAMEIMGLHKGGKDMAAWIEQQHYDTEEKLALWSLLPSDVRTAIKKQQSLRRELATQA